METKICTKCGVDKSLEDFGRRKANKDGLRSECKECHNRQSAKHYEEHKEKYKADHAEYYRENRTHVLERNADYFQKQKGKICERNKKRRWSNVGYRISVRLRTRLWFAIKGNYKDGSAVSDLGCTIEELKAHLESKFQPGMTWDNWAKDGWHIDHILPLVSFDLTDRKQFLQACHYTNLQPLWAKDNLAKGDRYEH